MGRTKIDKKISSKTKRNKQRLAKFENQRPSKEARLSNFKIPFKRRKSLINYFEIQWATIKKFFIVYNLFVVFFLSLIVGVTQFNKLVNQKSTEDELYLNFSSKEVKTEIKSLYSKKTIDAIFIIKPNVTQRKLFF